VGGAAGHVVGHHAVVGAVGGCLVGRHLDKKKKQEAKDAAEAKKQAEKTPKGNLDSKQNGA